RDAPTSGATIPICARWATCRRSTIPTSSARTSSCGSAVWSRLSPISPSISARSPRARSTSGWSTAMRRREAPRSPSNGRRAGSANRMESLITSHWQVMGESDRERRVKLVVDEWGAWHKMTTNLDPAHLFGQQSTIRDALVAGLTLDTFNRHADKVAMANIAQLVNCIQSLFLAHEDKFLVTPTYHVFAMYAAHQGARAVRTVVAASPVGWVDGQKRDHSLWGLNGSASLRGEGGGGAEPFSPQSEWSRFWPS